MATMPRTSHSCSVALCALLLALASEFDTKFGNGKKKKTTTTTKKIESQNFLTLRMCRTKSGNNFAFDEAATYTRLGARRRGKREYTIRAAWMQNRPHNNCNWPLNCVAVVCMPMQSSCKFIRQTHVSHQFRLYCMLSKRMECVWVKSTTKYATIISLRGWYSSA